MNRVSIIVPANVTNCSNPVAYAFEYPDAVYGTVRVAMLLAAKSSGQSVVINGSGACDQYAVEGIR